MDAVGDTLTRRVTSLFDGLTHLTGGLNIAVAFQTVSLVSSNGAPELCPHPEIGPSTMVGAEDGRTKLFGWRLLGIFPIGLEEGGSAVGGNPAGCHGAKRIFAKPVRGFVNEVYLGGDVTTRGTFNYAVKFADISSGSPLYVNQHADGTHDIVSWREVLT